MPRKVKTPESVAQNRDSQRRSRVRRRTIVEEMQKQLHEYRCRDAAASHEVQLAARQVARENRRLRALLALRGVSSDEIQAFLQSPDETIEALDAARTLHLAGASPPTSLSHRFGSTASATTRHSQELKAADDLMSEEIRGQDPQGLDTPTRDSTTPLETSCTAAADLIADLHGHIPVAKALMMLGCSGTNDCRVKNTEVFQLIDDVL